MSMDVFDPVTLGGKDWLVAPHGHTANRLLSTLQFPEQSLKENYQASSLNRLQLKDHSRITTARIDTGQRLHVTLKASNPY